MAVWWWFTMVQSVKKIHLKQSPGAPIPTDQISLKTYCKTIYEDMIYNICLYHIRLSHPVSTIIIYHPTHPFPRNPTFAKICQISPRRWWDFLEIDVAFFLLLHLDLAKIPSYRNYVFVTWVVTRMCPKIRWQDLRTERMSWCRCRSCSCRVRNQICDLSPWPRGVAKIDGWEEPSFNGWG